MRGLIVVAVVLLLTDVAPGPHTSYLPTVEKSMVPGKKAAGGCSCQELETIGASLGRMWYPEWRVCASGAVIVPELWGPPHWNAESMARIAGSGWLLGANEPDLTGTIADHVRAHHDVYEVACPPPCRLGSPAASHWGGITWLREWYNTYLSWYRRPPRLNFLDMHCYLWPGHGAQACIDKLRAYEQFGDEIGIPYIVVSETGWPPREYWSRQQAWAEAQPWLDELERNPRVLWVSIFACHVDEDAAWAGAEPPFAGWNWNELFSPAGLLTWDGRQWATWGQ